MDSPEGLKNRGMFFKPRRWSRMHKSPSSLSVGGGYRPARAATAKRKVFLKNVTTLSHNLCGAVMTAPYRQRVVSFPFPDKSNHISFCAYRLSSAIRQIGVCRCALKNTVIANQCAHWCGNPPVRGEMYRKAPKKWELLRFLVVIVTWFHGVGGLPRPVCGLVSQ